MRRPEGPEAVGSVVGIRTGGGHGSGALISTEGHIVTNAHLVGENRQVTVRWSDGLETVGEVLRKDVRRDVALVQTRPRGRQPLALKLEVPQVGMEVFAIGAPLDTELQGTVTRGIVSANRVIEGFSYVQIDVNINPGNSGGPLIDGQGRVIALSVSSLVDRGLPTGINLFIPAQDVVDFLT